MIHLPTINGASMTITVGGSPEICTSTALTAYEILEDIAEAAEVAHGGSWAVSWSNDGSSWTMTGPSFSWSTSDNVALGLSTGDRGPDRPAGRVGRHPPLVPRAGRPLE